MNTNAPFWEQLFAESRPLGEARSLVPSSPDSLHGCRPLGAPAPSPALPPGHHAGEGAGAPSAVHPAVCSVTLRLVRKGGRPWLLLPADLRLAARVLDLYPAQTLKARLARALLRCALAARLPLGTQAVQLAFSPAGEFPSFLRRVSGGDRAELPTFGLLAGNPAAPGQRVILLVFGDLHQPAAVVKAGLSDCARDLVEREERFLTSVPPQTLGLPQVRGSFANGSVRAFALDFFSGHSPRPEESSMIPTLLRAWLRRDIEVVVSQTRVWSELKAACGQHPVLAALAQRLENRSVRAAIVHGDLAPWNIKVSAGGSWTVLDWERGDLRGIPGWDWFHYLFQPAILVAREPTAALLKRFERLRASPEFQTYAKESAIAGLEREVALAYLLHHNEVIRPAEGLAQGRELANTLAQTLV